MSEPSTAFQPAQTPVAKGAKCTNCEYDLLGLFVGSPCPECGRVIGAAPRVPKLDSINNASKAYLRRLSLAMLAMGLTGMLIGVICGGSIAFPAIDVAFRFFSSVFRQQNASNWSQQAANNISPGMVSWAVLLVAGAYVASSAMVYLPRSDAIVRKGTEAFATAWTPLRKVVVGSQCAWILVAMFGIAEMHMTGFGLGWIAAVCMLIAVGGIAPASWLLADHADWGNDSGAASRLRAVVWMMTIGAGYTVVTGVLAAVGLSVGVLLFMWSWIFAVLFALGVLIYFLSALQLAAGAHWAIINAEQEAQRDARMAERARKREQEAAVHPQESFPTAVPDHLAEEIERKHREAELDPDLQKARELIGRGQPRVIGRNTEEVYDLEDDPKPDPDT